MLHRGGTRRRGPATPAAEPAHSTVREARALHTAERHDEQHDHHGLSRGQ
ncbi:hypothetical protein [Streptomyces longisporoflavus]|uniref:Uncharacterized protein n=1 Tax=Streptomyces longisporoflavus TaxID=28044 RepID=A0ABW7R341_9ACTN